MKALVIGCAKGVWEEVEAAKKLTAFDAVYCVKLAGVHYPDAFKTWVTLHPEFMADYSAQRHKLGLPNGYEIVAPIENELGPQHRLVKVDRRVAYRWDGMNSSGSSGLYGAKVALDDGCDKVILAGIPMVAAAEHFIRKRTWGARDSFAPAWQIAKPHLKGKVKSMSGWTQELLGAPTQEWLDSA